MTEPVLRTEFQRYFEHGLAYERIIRGEAAELLQGVERFQLAAFLSEVACRGKARVFFVSGLSSRQQASQGGQGTQASPRWSS